MVKATGQKQAQAVARTRVRDWRRAMSDHVAYGLLVYTGLQIFVTVKALSEGTSGLLPYLALIVLVAGIIPALRWFERRWAALDDDHGLSAWTPQRWADFARVCAASDFVIEQSVRDPLMLLELVAWGELDRGFAPGELCGQIAGAVQQAETEDDAGGEGGAELVDVSVHNPRPRRMVTAMTPAAT